MEFLDKALEAVNGASTGSLLMILTMAVEVCLRLVKTEKPRSILYTASDAMKKISELMAKVAELLDKVMQRTK